jgi:hypothetical protein
VAGALTTRAIGAQRVVIDRETLLRHALVAGGDVAAPVRVRG